MATLNSFPQLAVENALEAACGNSQLALEFLQSTTTVKPLTDSNVKKSVSQICDIITPVEMGLAFSTCLISPNCDIDKMPAELIELIVKHFKILIKSRITKVHFFLKKITGGCYTIEQPVFYPLYTWKQQVCNIHENTGHEEVTPHCMSIVWGGKRLNENKTAEDYSLIRENASTLVFHIPTPEEKELISEGVLSINQVVPDLRHYIGKLGNDVQVLKEILAKENILLSLGYEKQQIRRFLDDNSISIQQVIKALEDKRRRDEDSEREIARILEMEGGC